MQDPILGPYSDPAAGLRSKPHRVSGPWFFGIPTIILSVLGLHKAKEADSYGVVSLAGRILSWIAIAKLVLVYVLIVWAWFNGE